MTRDEERKEIGALSCREIKAIFRKKNKLKPHVKESTEKYKVFGKNLLQKCSHFPLYSLHTINCILNSKIRRFFNEYQLNGPSGAYLFEIMEQKAQKQTEFLMKVENRRYENGKMEFYHKKRVNYGTNDTNENQIIPIKIQREQVWDKYKQLISSSKKELLERHKANKLKQRILRVSHKLCDEN